MVYELLPTHGNFLSLEQLKLFNKWFKVKTHYKRANFITHI
jgi:hypothetical protein